MPDRTPEPAEGERQRYALPNEYGPARPSVGNDDDLDHFFDDDTPAVTLHDRDAEIEVESPSVGAAGAVAATEATSAIAATGPERRPRPRRRPRRPHRPTPAAPLSRREIREQREQEKAAAKSGGKKPPRSRRSKWIRRGIAIAVVILLIPVAMSYVDYINRPGSDTLSVKTVEWIRDNGGNGIVNTIERWWYTNNPPPTGGKPKAIKVQDTVNDTTGQADAPRRPPTRRSNGSRRRRPASPRRRPRCEPNEGVWQPTGRLVLGQPAVYTTYVRPDAIHTSYYTGLMWLDTKLLRANYIVGLEQPGGGGPNPWGSQIPDRQRGQRHRRVQLRLQDGLRQRRRVPRRHDDGAAARRLGVAGDHPGRRGQRRRVGT